MVSQNSLNNIITDNNFTVIHNNSGGSSYIQVQNTANAANSPALVEMITTHTSSDVWINYSAGGVGNWSNGVKTSDSNAFYICNAAGLGGSIALKASTAGAVSLLAGNLDVTRSASGADVSGTVSNSSNTASSSATQYLTVAGSTAADARTQYAVAGTTTWTQGIDNSDSDAYVLAASSALGTTNVMRASTAGALNYPLQPAFSASLSGNVTNATGDGTTYTIAYDTEAFDQGGNFGSNTFTAPVTGKYVFPYQISLAGLGSAHTGAIVTVAGVNTIRFNPFATQEVANGILTLSGCVFVALAASATAIMQVTVSGGTKTVTVVGGGSGCRFEGYLVA